MPKQADCQTYAQVLEVIARHGGFDESKSAVVSYTKPADKDYYITSSKLGGGVDAKFQGNYYSRNKKHTGFSVFDNHYVVWAFNSLYDPAGGGVTPLENCAVDASGATTLDCAKTYFRQTHPLEVCTIEDRKPLYEKLTCSGGTKLEMVPANQVKEWQTAQPTEGMENCGGICSVRMMGWTVWIPQVSPPAVFKSSAELLRKNHKSKSHKHTLSTWDEGDRRFF